MASGVYDGPNIGVDKERGKKSMEEASRCGTCIWNDDMLCDRFGVLVKEDDECIRNVKKGRDNELPSMQQLNKSVDFDKDRG